MPEQANQRKHEVTNMRIAQVSPLIESVPPVRFGGTQRIVSYLTEELVALGHDVTLFASADSITSARLIPGAAKALRYDKNTTDHLSVHINMLKDVVDRAPEFDLIHFHTGHLHYALTRYISTAHITTRHTRLDIPEQDYFYREYNHIPVVSVSADQRRSFRKYNWLGTVPYGIPEDLYDFSARHNSYLAFLGRISPDKGILEAIAIAQRSNMALKIAAKVDEANEDFFDEFVKPHLQDPRIEFVGEINNTEKNHFLGNAYALLLPLRQAGPFEIVTIEAMACGTPVIAFRRGSVAEILQHGETGYIVDDIDAAVNAIAQLEKISRKNCHATFKNRFTAKHMVNNYLNIYDSSIAAHRQGWADIQDSGFIPEKNINVNR